MKTIADIAVEVLRETDNTGIMFGDTRLLDMVAERATHTNLMDKFPMVRHSRILNALEGDDRFDKRFVRMPGVRGNQIWRWFELKETMSQYTNDSAVPPNERIEE